MDTPRKMLKNLSSVRGIAEAIAVSATELGSLNLAYVIGSMEGAYSIATAILLTLKKPSAEISFQYCYLSLASSTIASACLLSNFLEEDLWAPNTNTTTQIVGYGFTLGSMLFGNWHKNQVENQRQEPGPRGR